jgi:phytoene dehydrogenase-like protein
MKVPRAVTARRTLGGVARGLAEWQESGAGDAAHLTGGIMAAQFDAIIIGAGHNGLVCGSYLAKAGLRVLVLERRHVIGGAAVTEEFSPGFRGSIFSYVMSLLHPRVIADLELRKFGLEVLPANDLFCPLPGDDYIIFSDDAKKTQAHFARFSGHDAEIYPAFDAYLQEAAAIVRRLLFETPIDPTRRDWRTFKDAAAFLWRYRKVGRKAYRIVDLLTQSAYDYLSEWFESDIIKAVLAYYASIGTFAGPKSPGSAYVIMHHVMGEHQGAGGWGFIRGGMGSITQAIAASGRRFGLEVLTEAGVGEVVVAHGRATGVRTLDGREFSARAVISNASAKLLFQKLVAPSLLPSEFLADIERFRTFSTAFKINIAAEAPPLYRAFDKAKAGFDYPTYVHLGPDIDYLERAYDDAKYGWYSSKPFVTPVVPTIVDDSLAPKGKHVVNLFGGHAPYQLKNADWSHERDSFVRNVMGVVNEFAPGFSDQVIDMQVLLPPDIEEIVALPQGHIFQGELSPDQLFFQRPAPHYADYRTPIGALYQCGSSCHPGGGVSGIPGYNAAREILKDWPSLKRAS